VAKILTAYGWQYTHSGYENLPVKSSPTQLLSEGKYIPKQHFADFGKIAEEDEMEEEANKDLVVAEGTAYHAFLEHFDFSLLIDEDGKAVEKSILEEVVAERLEAFLEYDVRVDLLSKEKLVEILSNSVFYELQGMRLYKEQQFLVSLPVKDTYAKKEGVDAALLEKEDGEEMIFQGAIDLLAVGETVRIIDYKYSNSGAAALKERYKPQLDLYKLPVAKIMKIDVKTIRCSIVNIRKGFQVDMD
jgi:ATP-dependent exoDNAse (exonuclease V) beta subunit